MVLLLMLLLVSKDNGSSLRSLLSKVSSVKSVDILLLALSLSDFLSVFGSALLTGFGVIVDVKVEAVVEVEVEVVVVVDVVVEVVVALVEVEDLDFALNGCLKAS
jgi:hypothetical protein